MSKEYIEREKVIEVIKNYGKNAIDIGQSSLDPVDDILLLQGAVGMIPAADVIAPPCKVGDTVYVPWTWDGQEGVGFAEVEEIKIYDNKNHIMFFIDLQSDIEEFNQKYGGWKLDESIGKTIFLIKEEAEQALKEQ